jgi:HEAT repeat protein
VSLGRLGQAAVAPLLQALASASGATREPIIRALGQVGEPAAAAVPQLIAIVRESPDANRTDRSPDEAIQALRRIGAGAEPAIPALVQLVLEEDGSRGLTAAFALSDLGPAAIAALRGALPHASPRSISWIATSLGGLKDQARAAVPELVAALARAGESRGDVIRALGEIGPGASEAAAPLSGLLATDPANRMWILRALAKIGAADGPVVPEIAKLLDQLPPPQPLYRVTPEVVDTLGIIGTPQDVRLALESFYTAGSRPASNFAGFVRRKIGDDAFDRYGAAILAASRVSTPHYCEGTSFDRAAGDAEYAADALRALGPEAASAADALRRAREKFGLCFNVAASIDAALSAVGSPGTQ